MGPWGTTRSAYVNWAATNKVDKLPAGPREISGGGHTEDLMQTGGDGDAALVSFEFSSCYLSLTDI